jgi:hypothetical protein
MLLSAPISDNTPSLAIVASTPDKLHSDHEPAKQDFAAFSCKDLELSCKRIKTGSSLKATGIKRLSHKSRKIKNEILTKGPRSKKGLNGMLTKGSKPTSRVTGTRGSKSRPAEYSFSRGKLRTIINSQTRCRVMHPGLRKGPHGPETLAARTRARSLGPCTKAELTADGLMTYAAPPGVLIDILLMTSED